MRLRHSTSDVRPGGADRWTAPGAYSVLIESEPKLWILVWTRFLHANRYPFRSKTLAVVDQQIERARISRQVAPEQAAGLEPDPPGRFEPDSLHPLRRAGARAGQEVEEPARGLDDADIGKPRCELLDEG